MWSAGQKKNNTSFYSMKFKNHYETLGISMNADISEIREAYLEISKKYKSKNNQLDDFSLSMLNAINEAFEILSNPIKREKYDKTLLLNDVSFRASTTHNDLSEQDVIRINTLTEKYFEKAKEVETLKQQYLTLKNIKQNARISSTKIFLCLVLIVTSIYYYHPGYFKFLKGTPVEELKEYEWIATESSCIYQKPNSKSKALYRFDVNKGFNSIGETTYYLKVSFIDENGKNKTGYVKKQVLKANREIRIFN